MSRHSRRADGAGDRPVILRKNGPHHVGERKKGRAEGKKYAPKEEKKKRMGGLKEGRSSQWGEGKNSGRIVQIHGHRKTGAVTSCEDENFDPNQRPCEVFQKLLAQPEISGSQRRPAFGKRRGDI